jgi:hypothetical protein
VISDVWSGDCVTDRKGEVKININYRKLRVSLDPRRVDHDSEKN